MDRGKGNGRFGNLGHTIYEPAIVAVIEIVHAVAISRSEKNSGKASVHPPLGMGDKGFGGIVLPF